MAESAPKPGQRDGFSFEEAFKKLEATAQSLEAGGLTLEQTTRLYEEGLRLARICSELLSAAELRITRIQTSFGEQMRFLAQDDLDETPVDGVSEESPPYDAEAP